MNLTLLHGSLEPLIYGVVIFVGMAVTWWKLTHGKFLSASVDIGVFALVFSMHGGTMTGGFAATIAALMAGLIFPLMWK
jgi:hypothetical protein